jgi:uncharacterized membrane protein
MIINFEVYMQKNKVNVYLALSMVLLAVVSRFIPHPPNFTPLMAMSIFSGILFLDRRFAILIPLVAMIITDFVLGLHSSILFVYVSLTIGVLMGFKLRENQKLGKVMLFSLIGSIQFFVITNFGYWLTSGLYPRTAEGLSQAFFFGLPFFSHTPVELFAFSLAGDLIFCSLFYGVIVMADKVIHQTAKS